MSNIPAKYKCDEEGCNKEASFNDAAFQEWRVVTYSDNPKYIAINAWSNAMPERLRIWHACGNMHAEAIVALELWRLS